MHKVCRTVLLLVLIGAPVATWAQSANDRYPFVKDGKVGFIDYQGREVIPPRFGNAGDTAHFDDGLAPVFEPEKGFGYIDWSGKFVIGPTMEWGWGRPFHEGIAAIMIIGKNDERSRPAWIDRTGKIVFTGLGTEGAYFSDGLMPMPRGGKWGFVNKQFKFVIQPQFDSAYGFYEGRAEVTLNHKSGFIDTGGKTAIALKYDMVWPFHDGLARVRYNFPNGTVMTIEGEQPVDRYQYGFVDHDGSEVISPQFEEATYFSEGPAMVAPFNFKLFGIIDKSGNFVHQPEFEDAEEFHEGLAVACMKKRCGYVDTSGTWIIQPTFSHAEQFWRGLARVYWKDGEYGYVDKTGKTVWRSSSLAKRIANVSLRQRKLWIEIEYHPQDVAFLGRLSTIQSDMWRQLSSA
jgi:hypothetical protein